MKLINKLLVCLAFVLTIGVIQPVETNAKSSISVTASASEVEIGDTVTFTVTVSGGAGSVSISGSVSDSVFLDNESKTYTATATEAGSLTLTASGFLCDNEYTGADGQNVEDYEASYTDSASVTVTAPPPPPPPSGGDEGSGDSGDSGTTQTPPPPPVVVKSSDARLWSLTVDKGELSPSFDMSVTNYTVTVTNEASEITISAEANHSEATVSGTGTKPIKLGDNSFAIDVRAEDGTKKTYMVNVVVEEKPLTYLEFNGEQYGILQESNETQPPKGFEPKKGIINEEENTIFVNKNETLTLIHAIGPDEQLGFYIYDQDEGIIGLYRPLYVNGKEVYIIPVPEALQTREAMAFATMTINDEELQVWSFNDTELVGYSLLYVMDENGEKSYYVYDENEAKLLRYPDSTPVTYDDFVKAGLINKEPVNYGLYGGIGAALLLIIIIFFATKKKKTKKVEVEEKIEEEVFDSKEMIEPENEVIEEVVEEEIHPIDTDLNKIKEYQEHELDTNLHVEKIIQPVIPVVEEEEEEWISDDFYKTIFGDED